MLDNIRSGKKSAKGDRRGGAHPVKLDLFNDVLRGTLIGGGVFLALIAASSVLLMRVSLTEIQTAVLFIACCCISAVAGGFFCARKPRKNGIVMGAAGAAPLMLVILFATLLVNAGKAGTNIAILIPLMIVFGICGGVVAVNMKKRVK